MPAEKLVDLVIGWSIFVLVLFGVWKCGEIFIFLATHIKTGVCS